MDVRIQVQSLGGCTPPATVLETVDMWPQGVVTEQEVTLEAVDFRSQVLGPVLWDHPENLWMCDHRFSVFGGVTLRDYDQMFRVWEWW